MQHSNPFTSAPASAPRKTRTSTYVAPDASLFSSSQVAQQYRTLAVSLRELAYFTNLEINFRLNGMDRVTLRDMIRLGFVLPCRSLLESINTPENARRRAMPLYNSLLNQLTTKYLSESKHSDASEGSDDCCQISQHRRLSLQAKWTETALPIHNGLQGLAHETERVLIHVLASASGAERELQLYTCLDQLRTTASAQIALPSLPQPIQVGLQLHLDDLEGALERRYIQ